jgi:hypothetical protein
LGELAAIKQPIVMNLKLKITLATLAGLLCIGLYLKTPFGYFTAGCSSSLLLTNSIGQLVVRRHNARQQRWLQAAVKSKL